MTDPKRNVFDEIENELRSYVIAQIHKCADNKLADALARWYGSQDVTTATLMATTAAFLGQIIYDRTEQEDHGCALAQSYNDYIHNFVHACYKEYPKGPTSKKGH